LTVLRHLDVDLFRAHPKPFFGYSDNTNLLNFMFHAGAEAGVRRRAACRDPAGVRKYAPDATVVFDIDFGHTDPNQVIPYGGDIRIDGLNRTISVRYRSRISLRRNSVFGGSRCGG
jgi:muramoyltetrapeptide carboxypeptidase LdcA involved in peptidoglycan recycling